MRAWTTGLFLLALLLVGAISMQLLSPSGAQQQAPAVLEHYGGPRVDHSMPPKLYPWTSGDQQVSAY